MEKIGAFFVGLLVVVPFLLGVYWLYWSLFCWIVPRWWPTGPEQIIRPDYWTFAATVAVILFFKNGGVNGLCKWWKEKP